MNDVDWGDVLLHMALGALFGVIIVMLYTLHVIDVWPITVLASLAMPFRELTQHDWDPRRLVTKTSIALEAWPAFFVVWAADLGSRAIIGAVQH